MADSSFENPTTDSHPGSSPGRLRADVHRAVGGTLGLIRECNRIMHHLDANVSADWVVKRVQFLSYELETWVIEEMSQAERLAVLNEYFYSTHGFRCWKDAPPSLRPLDALNLTRTVVERGGSSLVVALIYGYLGERIGLNFSFVDFKPAQFLKWNDQGLSKFIDLTRKGSILSSDELLNLMHENFAASQFPIGGLLEVYSFEGFIVRFLEEIRATRSFPDHPEKLLFLQNTLIEYQPSQISLLADRAVLHRRLGNFKAALGDLKRYFAFYERDKSSPEICKLYDDLVVMNDRQRQQPEISD